MRQHDRDEEEEKAVADPDARQGAGSEREHENRYDKDIEHGPFAEVRDEFIERLCSVRRQPGIQPKRQQGVHLHEWKADGEDEEYQEQKDFAGFPEYHEALADRNLIAKKPELRNRGERKKNAREKATERCQEHEQDGPTRARMCGDECRIHAAVSKTIFGCFAAIFSRTLAGPAGLRRPCSQF